MKPLTTILALFLALAAVSSENALAMCPDGETNCWRSIDADEGDPNGVNYYRFEFLPDGTVDTIKFYSDPLRQHLVGWADWLGVNGQLQSQLDFTILSGRPARFHNLGRVSYNFQNLLITLTNSAGERQVWQGRASISKPCGAKGVTPSASSAQQNTTVAQTALTGSTEGRLEAVRQIHTDTAFAHSS